MAQHDYVIDNSTGANVRADINNALGAIIGNNSGDPSTLPATAPFMLVADTTDNTMKIRNAANNGFIELFQLDGTFTLEDGSASTPALPFRGDLNTGIFSSAADTFNVATGGVERLELASTGTVFNDGGVDVDFRIEGDTDANLFFVDAGNNRIGIGTSSPTSKLDIAGDVTITSTQPKLFLTDTNSASDYSLQNANGNIEFVDETNNATRMRIVSDGDATFTSVAGNASFTFKKGNAPSGEQSVTVKFDRNGTVIGGVGAPTQITGTSGNDMGIAAVNGGNIRFGTGSGGSATNRVSVDTTGDMTIHDGDLVIGTAGHGIDFSANTGATGMTSEILDAYEEGTWTPTIGYQNSTGLTISTNSAAGKYTKIGRLVMVIGAINFTVSGSPVNDNVFLGGLPFDSDTGKVGTGATRYAGCNIRIENTSDDSSIYMAGNYGTDSINLGVQQDMGNRANELGGNSGMVIRVQIFYHTA